jgi:hypothetical protein
MERSSAERTAALADLLDHGPALEEPASVIDHDKLVALDKVASEAMRLLPLRPVDPVFEFKGGVRTVYDERTNLKLRVTVITASGEQPVPVARPQRKPRV